MRDPRLFNHLLFALKLTILSVCLLAVFGGHHPPVQAQSQHVRVQSVPVVTTEDAMQDDRITAINRHLESIDAAIEMLRKASELQGNEVSTVRGEIEAFGLLLTVLSIAAIVLQIKRK
jgi:hypothetical protein